MAGPNPVPPLCGYELMWWAGVGEGTYCCSLPSGHLTFHADGPVTFDNDDIVECRCKSQAPWSCLLHQSRLPIPSGPF